MVYERESVMVIPAAVVTIYGVKDGFFSLDAERATDLMSFLFQHARFMDRAAAEADPRYKQLIPYVLYRWPDHRNHPWLFQYRRTTKQGETRLHGKCSLGVGGHVRPTDGNDMSGQYWGGLTRELLEEVDVSEACASHPQVIGVINDNADDVGKVHLGIVHCVDVQFPKVTALEDSMADAAFQPMSQQLLKLRETHDYFEGWSVHCLRGMAARHNIV